MFSWAMIGFKGARPGHVVEDRGGAATGDCSRKGRDTAKIADTFYQGRLAGFNPYALQARAYGRG